MLSGNVFSLCSPQCPRSSSSARELNLCIVGNLPRSPTPSFHLLPHPSPFSPSRPSSRSAHAHLLHYRCIGSGQVIWLPRRRQSLCAPTLCTCADRGVCLSPWQHVLGDRVSVEGSVGAAYSFPCSVIGVVNASVCGCGVFKWWLILQRRESVSPCDKGRNN